MRTLILLPLLLLGLGFNLASAQGTLSPVGQQVFLDNSGNPINNGKICTYAAGSSTPLATYSDVSLMTANANPVRTSSAGRPTTGGIYLSPTSYKFVVLTAGTDNTCSTGTTIWTQDNISAVPAANVALDTTGTAGEALALGDVVFLSAGDGGLTAGRWYKADADFTYRSSTAGTVGVAIAAITSGASGSIRLSGRLTGLSALTTGEIYYASATAGALTSTPPTNQRLVGQADSTTTLIIGANPGGVRLPDNDGTHFLSIIVPTNLTADRLFNLIVPDAATTFTLTGSQTLNQSVASGASPTFVGTNFTSLNATQLTTGTVPAARLPSGSTVQRVVATYATQTDSTTNVFADTGLTATITPTSASNKIVVRVNIAGIAKVNDTYVKLQLLRDSTNLGVFGNSAGYTGSAATNRVGGESYSKDDSPASTSALVYKVQFASGSNIATATVQQNNSISTIELSEVVP